MAIQLSSRIGLMRGLLLVINIIFVLASIALIGIGIYVKINNNFSAVLNKLTEVSNFEGQSLGFLAFVLIGGGVFTLLISLLGCMGSLWHNRCLLYMYSIILGILMTLQLVGFIMAMVYKNNLEAVYRKNLLQVLTTALNHSDTKVLDAFSDIERSLKCCGVNGLQDYAGKEPENLDCYRYSAKGCSGVIMDLLNKNLPIIGTTLGIILLFELFGLVGAILLAIGLKDAPDVYYSSNPGEVIINAIPRRPNYKQVR